MKNLIDIEYDNINADEQDDFRRIQEESRRIHAETIQQRVYRTYDVNERSRINISLRRELASRGYRSSFRDWLNVIQLGDSTDKTKTYSLYDNEKAATSLHKTHISGKQDVTAYAYNILKEEDNVNSAF